MPFEYWNLPKSDNVTTRIVRCYKDGKYIVFTRDITLEIRTKRIVQAKRKYNQEPSEEELEIIKKWNKKYNKFELE